MDTNCPDCGQKSENRGWQEYAEGGRGNRRRCNNDDCDREGFTVSEQGHATGRVDLKPGKHIEGNEAEIVTHPYSEPPTLDQILTDWNVDRAEWEVKNWRPGQSDVTMKLKQPDKSDKVVTVTNYHAKVYLVRIRPTVCEWPVAAAGTLKPYKRIAVKKRGGLKRAVVYPDVQIGFKADHATGDREPTHDERALSLVGQVIKTLQPDRVVGLGDLLDFAEQSTHFVRRPEFYFQTQPAIDRAVSWIHGLRGYAGEWDELSGNHDIRLESNIVENAIAAHGLRPGLLDEEGPPDASLSIPKLLRFDELDVTYSAPYPDGIVWLNPNLGCVHGEKVGAKPGQTVTKSLERPRTSLIGGHVHRLESGHTTVHHHGGQKTYGYYSPGCLCRIDGAVPGRNARPDWQQGFAVVEYDDDLFRVELVPIFDGRCAYGGKTWEAE